MPPQRGSQQPWEMPLPASLANGLGYEIHVSPVLVGEEMAFLIGQRSIVVSRELRDSMAAASPEQLKAICERVHCVRLPDFELPYKFRVEAPDFEVPPRYPYGFWV